MPFPFLPSGAIVAASVLVGALTLFGLILRAMDRAITGVRDMAVSSIVSGMRGWSQSRPIHVPVVSPHVSPFAFSPEPPTASPSPTAADPAPGLGGPEIVDLVDRPIEEPALRR